MRWRDYRLKSRDCVDRYRQIKNAPTPIDTADQFPDFLAVREAVSTALDAKGGRILSPYQMDIGAGLALHASMPDLEARTAANVEFWRKVSLDVMPDLVAIRWPDFNEDRVWTNNRRRLWLMQIWWYVELLWQGDQDTTKELLETPGLSTDTILNVVERPGLGYRSDLQSAMFKELRNNYSNKITENLIRNIQKLNTAKSAVMVPEFCTGGVENYASELVREMLSR
jgi:hypothetical protein